MSSFISCPECKRKLKVPDSMAGKSFRCPGCRTVISADDVEEEDTPAPSRAVKTAPSPRTTAALPRSRPPRDEEPVDELEPEEEEPVREKPRRKKRPIRKQSSTGLIIGLVAGGAVLLLLMLGGGGGLLWYFLRNKGIPQSEWQAFSPPNSGCTILMPGSPVSQTLNMLGVTLNQYQVERKKENVIFAVMFCDLPVGALPPNALATIANGGRDGALRLGPAGSNVTSEIDIFLGNIPGREIQIKPPTQGTFITRTYLAKFGNRHRVLLLMAGGDSIQPNTGDAARFFDSFKIDTSATAPNFDAAAPPIGAQPPPAFKPPPMNPKPNPPGPNPGRRPKRPGRPFSASLAFPLRNC